MSSNHWAPQFQALVASFIHFTPHAQRYLNELDFSDYMEVTDPDGVPLADNDEGLTDQPFDPNQATMSNLGPFGHPITFTGYTHDAERAFRGHRWHSDSSIMIPGSQLGTTLTIQPLFNTSTTTISSFKGSEVT